MKWLIFIVGYESDLYFFSLLINSFKWSSAM